MMVFAPGCSPDAQWAYLYSHEARLSTFEYSENVNAVAQLEGNSRGGKKEEQRGKSVKKEIIDRLSGIIDTEDPRFANLKQENVKYWEQGVQSLCQSMIKGVDKFYEGQTRVYSSIMQSILENREDFIPQAAESDSYPQFVQQAANEPYTFQSFPLCGAKIDPNVRDPTKFVQLHEKLNQSASLSLWHEPIDILNNGPEFFEGLHEMLLSSAKAFVEKKESYSEEDLETLATL